jgi:hypothetical protein
VSEGRYYSPDGFQGQVGELGDDLQVQIQAHFRLKPHLREIFRHLDVTRRYTLKPFPDEL